ncbi:MAG: hypothetical protein V4553_15875 [Bacteroidota bacterium]
MKRPFLIIILCACIIAGCKKDDAQKDAEVTVLGKWYVKSIYSSGGISAGTNTAFTANDYYLFNNDKTVVISQSTPTAVSATLAYSYVKDSSGEKITLSNTDRTTVYNVSKLTADSLVMATAPGSGGGATVISNATYRFARK